MKSRTRLILLVVGSVALFGVVGALAFFVGLPYLDRVKAVEKAEADARRAEDDLDALAAQAKKLKPLEKRGLPAGVLYTDDPKRTRREYAEVAKQEYELALTKILKDAGARNATVNFIDGESNNKAGIPQMDPTFKPNNASDPAEYLTYTQIVYKVEIPKADLGTIGEVLRRYYSLDLLHQITHLNIRQTAANELGKDERPEKERSDLKVEITTRAIIINGAERRRSLSPAPTPLVGLVSGLGAVPYQQSTSVSRKLPATPAEPILAKSRDYALLPAKDPFHGRLPEYPDLPPKEEKKDVVVIPPKPDLREFIVYTTSIHSEKGDEHSVEIVIKDKINQDEYQVVVSQVGEKVVAKVTKFYFDNFKTNPADRKKKEYMNEPTLEISKFTMSNKNNFTIYGVDTDGSLILGEKPFLPELPKDEKKPAGPGGGGGRPQPPAKPTLPPADPKAAVIGGPVAFAPRAEKFYRWKSGDNLKQIVELSKSEADAAIRRAQTRFLPTPTSSPTGTSPQEAKGGE